jgi:RNA polymerase sigma-70 factor, ECF subfamily
MQELADGLQGHLVDVEDALEREFETRLVESSTLAFRVAFSVVRNREDAEDVAQEAFAKAHRNFRRLRDRDRFRAWLVRTTWRTALDRRRADRRRAARELAHAAEAPRVTTIDSTMVEDRAERLWRAVDALPEKLRVAIVLANIEGHGIDEVAALLRLPVGTVKSRLFLARQRLKEQLL